MEIEDREIEYSPLSGRVTRDGVTVDVKVYRFAGTNDPWQLEVVDHEGGSTVWDDPLPTARDAYRAFDEAVEEDGMASFAASNSGTIH
jgi:hypothetical protein